MVLLYITNILLHLTIWIVLLSIIVPLSMFLWFVVYDVFIRESSVIKSKIGLTEFITQKNKSEPKLDNPHSNLSLDEQDHLSAKEKQVIYLDKESSFDFKDENLSKDSEVSKKKESKHL